MVSNEESCLVEMYHFAMFTIYRVLSDIALPIFIYSFT